MQTALDHQTGAHRRPAAVDFVAAGLLLATVVLHVVAMAPTYFVGTGSLMGQTDQATLYSVLAASWALALVIGLIGPHRTPVAAAIAVGVAVTELGFRVADLGDAVKYGSATVGAGLWLMTAAWVVGAVAAVAAVVAARARHAGPPTSVGTPVPATEPPVPPAEISEGPDASEGWTTGWTAPAPGDSPPAEDPTSALPPVADTSTLPAVHAAPPEDEHERLSWTLLVGLLAAIVAGAFLPAWDHAVAYSTQSGASVTRSLGNAFTGPWQQVLGTVLAGVALLVVPLVAIRLRNKAVGAAAVVGGLLVLASQMAAAVVQVDQPVPPSDLGITSSQASSLGLELSLRLTGWFTVDALAAYGLFAAVMVWATLRLAHENSPGTPPITPERRSEAMPSAS